MSVTQTTGMNQITPDRILNDDLDPALSANYSNPIDWRESCYLKHIKHVIWRNVLRPEIWWWWWWRRWRWRWDEMNLKGRIEYQGKREKNYKKNIRSTRTKTLRVVDFSLYFRNKQTKAAINDPIIRSLSNPPALTLTLI